MMSLPAGQAVVMFSTADWFWPYWTNKQHIAARLAARGFRVLYVESIGLRSPALNSADLARIWRRFRRAATPIRELQTNVWLLSPLTIPAVQNWRGIADFNYWQLGGKIQSWLRRISASHPIVWTYHPYMLRVAHELQPAALVYHCVDNLGAVPGVNSAAFDLAERELLARSDCVFATSPDLRDRCAVIARDRTDYFGNVADVSHFAKSRHSGSIPAELEAIPRPRLAYVGVISDFKIDFDLIEQAATRRRDWNFVFIGDEREGQHSAAFARLTAMTNVYHLGWRPYAQLPDYLRGVDVALLPQRLNVYTRAMFPMKYFEYLGAGLPIVATELPALAEFACLHLTADGVNAFVACIESALAKPMIVRADHPALLAHTWDARLDVMLQRVARINRRGPQC